jgi:hypothetical protein
MSDNMRLRRKNPSGNIPAGPKGSIPPVNTSYMEIYIASRGQNLLQYPSPLKPNPSLKFSKKYCQFHREKGHDTEDCYALKKEVKRLLA